MGRHISNLASWCNLMVPDVAKASAFYADLLGWSYRVALPDAASRAIAEVNGEAVAELLQSSPDSTYPAAWSICFTTSLLAPTQVRITDAFGEIVFSPSDYRNGEQMALAQDPTGAVFGVREHQVSFLPPLADGPGSIAWRELNTRDPDNAATFYAQVFGLQSCIRSTGEQSMRLTLHEPGQLQPLAGIRAIDESFDRRVTNHWLIYFRVSRLQRAIERVIQLGGTLEHGPYAMHLGRAARCTDHQDARFCLVEIPQTSPTAAV